MQLFRLVLLVFSAVATIVFLETNAFGADAPRNVVLIVADDLGLQLGCYGDMTARTPHIDRLAKTGVRFTRAYCTTASCSASRSVILTGLYNHATGHYGHSHGYNHFSTYDTVRTLPVMLSEAGYRTANFGKYHVAPEYVYRFDHRDPTQARNPVAMAERAKAWIEKASDKPFFVFFCPVDPHRAGNDNGDQFANRPDEADPYPGVKREVFDPEKIAVPAWLPDQPKVRSELAQFYQSISRFDAGVGRLLDVLKETGHADDTLVLFISDNGPPFPGAKTTLYEPGINLPLIVRDPTQANVGKTCDAIVTWADLAPTILEFCGVEVKPSPKITPMENSGEVPKNRPVAPYRLHGRSFLTAMQAEHPDGWDETFFSHTYHEITNYYPMRAIRSGRYKLIVNFAHPLPFPFASDLYESPTWQGVLARKNPQERYGPRTVEAYQHRPRFEFYDLDDDPWESNNLIGDVDFAPVVETLIQKIRDWQEATHDPWAHKWEYE